MYHAVDLHPGVTTQTAEQKRFEHIGKTNLPAKSVTSKSDRKKTALIRIYIYIYTQKDKEELNKMREKSGNGSQLRASKTRKKKLIIWINKKKRRKNKMENEQTRKCEQKNNCDVQ